MGVSNNSHHPLSVYQCQALHLQVPDIELHIGNIFTAYDESNLRKEGSILAPGLIQAIMVGKGWHWEWQEDGYIVSTVRKHRDACLPSLNFQITVHTPGNDKRTFTNVLSSGARCLSLSTYVSLPDFLPPALFSGYEKEDNEGCTRSNKCFQNWVAYCHDPSLIDLLV